MAYYNPIFEKYVTYCRTKSLLTITLITIYLSIDFLIVTIAIANNIICSSIGLIKNLFHRGCMSESWITSKLSYGRDSK